MTTVERLEMEVHQLFSEAHALEGAAKEVALKRAQTFEALVYCFSAAVDTRNSLVEDKLTALDRACLHGSITAVDALVGATNG